MSGPDRVRSIGHAEPDGTRAPRRAGRRSIALTGCGTLLRNPVPASTASTATIPHLPDVRAWAGMRSAAMEQDLVAPLPRNRARTFRVAADGTIHYAHLALSGGGASGAFGAGFLNGWSQAGDRPKFKIVTGVSTGALMAPFALLGPSYDGALREFYTTTSSRDIFIVGSFLNLATRLLAGEALLDTSPLVALIAQHVDAELLRKVGEAHEHGQRLYIGTVDLDSLEFVVWNMGLIALSGRPESLDLFRKVMLASASIPIAFPPVLFDVEADGRRYDELHVDGGVGARVFYNGGLFRPSIIRQRGGQGAGGRARRHLHHSQRADPSRRAADPQNRPGDRHASPRCLESIRRDRRPLPDLCDRAERAGQLPLGHHSRGNHRRGRGNLRSGRDAGALRRGLPERRRGRPMGNAPAGTRGRSAP